MIDKAFEMAYGRPISPADRQWLKAVGIRNSTASPRVLRSVIDALRGRNRSAPPVNLMRSVIAAFDRQTHPTPITIRFGAAQISVVELSGFKLALDTDDISVSRQIIAAKDYESHLRAFVESILRPGMTAIDVGANVGFYTMHFASIVGKAGKVLAFEPNSENCRLILLSVAENVFPQVRLFPFALTEAAGAVFFSPAMGSNGGLMPDKSETLTHPNCTVVPCQRLDQIVNERVDFIKLDIEGAEYRALSGGIELIKKWRPVVTVEFSMEMLPRVSGIAGADFLKLMTGFGYRGYLLPQDGSGKREIADIDRFLAEWGNLARIEDLAFIPR